MKSIKVTLTNFFEAWIDVVDFVINADQYLIMPLDSEYACRKCGKKLTIKYTPKFISILCGCGCRVFYPPDKDGVIISNFITAEEHERGKYRNGSGHKA